MKTQVKVIVKIDVAKCITAICFVIYLLTMCPGSGQGGKPLCLLLNPSRHLWQPPQLMPTDFLRTGVGT